MRVYPAADDADNTFSLYEDDGISLDYKNGSYATTDLRYTQKGKKASVTVSPAQGSYPGQTLKRSYILQLPGMKDGGKVSVNGKKVKTEYDKTVGCHVVKVGTTPVSKSVTIEYDI